MQNRYVVGYETRANERERLGSRAARSLPVAFLSLTLILAIFTPFLSSTAAAQTMESLTLLQDAHTESQSPNTNFGTSTTLDMKHGRNGPSADCGVSDCLHTLLEFDVSGIPDTAIILDANLTVQTIDTGTGGFTTQVRVVLASWSESTLTWNNEPSLGPVLDEFFSDVEVGAIRSYNITNATQGLIGTSTFGLAFLNDSSPNKFQEWGADENPARTAASLTVIYELPPPSPDPTIAVLITAAVVVVAAGFVSLVGKKDRSLEDLGLWLLILLIAMVIAAIAITLFPR